MSPLKGNGKVLFKIRLFKKKKKSPRSPAINQLYVQTLNLQTQPKANGLGLGFLHTHLPTPSIVVLCLHGWELRYLWRRRVPCWRAGRAPCSDTDGSGPAFLGHRAWGV